MAFSPFLSAAFAGVDFDWLPDSSIKPWNNINSEFSDSCGDGSPPQQPLSRRPTNNFLLHQTFDLLNPSLQTYDLLQSPPPQPSAADILLNSPSFPAGDFQRKKKKKNERAESPINSCESSITIIEGMSRACKYSPEQKKERIERYKIKRNKRNFNKKIKYACRKSLADSRPRIRGRFARYNDDVVKNYPMQWSNIRRGENEEEEKEDEANGGDNWIKYFIDAYSSNLIP